MLTELRHFSQRTVTIFEPTENSTLSTWLLAEKEAMAALDQGVGPGALAPAKLAALNGHEVMQAMMRGALPYAVCAKTNHYYAVEASPGKAIFQGTPSQDQLNPMGTVNGGWISGILDSALGSAVLTTLPPGWGYFTIDLNVHYLKVLTLATPKVRAIAEVVESDEKDVRAKAALVDAEGKVYAESRAVCRLMNPAGKSNKR